MQLNFDGASRGNPGPSAWGWVLLNENGEEEHSEHGLLGVTTNNVAEYSALFNALLYLKQKNITNVVIKGDSKLVVNQLNTKKTWDRRNPLGRYCWQCKNEKLIPLRDKCAWLLNQLFPKGYCLVHVPREMNQMADTECNKAFDVPKKN